MTKDVQKEDAAAVAVNNVSGGQIAGTDANPPGPAAFKRKKKSRGRRLRDVVSRTDP
jgi:hypothetical protein